MRLHCSVQNTSQTIHYSSFEHSLHDNVSAIHTIQVCIDTAYVSAQMNIITDVKYSVE